MGMRQIELDFRVVNHYKTGTVDHDQNKAIARVRHGIFEIDKAKDDSVRKKARIDKQNKENKARFRNKLVRITHNKKSIYVILAFWTGKLNDGEIALTNLMKEGLGIENTKEPVRLEIRLAKNRDIDKFFDAHPDPALRMTERLSRRRQWSAALLGFALGIVGSYSVRALDIGFGSIAKFAGALMGQ